MGGRGITAVGIAAAAVLTAAACSRAGRVAPLPETTGPVPPPAASSTSEAATTSPWVIVYSPHPDDETIALGQAIRRYVLAGYSVQLVLLTDGETSHSYQTYYRRHPELWADLDHDGVKGDPGDFGLERRREFTRAAGILGVPPSRLAFFGVASGRRDGLSSDFMPLPKVEAIMRGFEEQHPGALHLTVMKHTDGKPRGPGDLLPQKEHTLACESLAKLARDEGVRAAFYKVYVYNLPPDERWSPEIENDPDDHPVKRRALLGGYDDADQRGHLAIGWHSVPVLIDDVLVDTREYRVPLEDVPKP